MDWILASISLGSSALPGTNVIGFSVIRNLMGCSFTVSTTYSIHFFIRSQRMMMSQEEAGKKRKYSSRIVKHTFFHNDRIILF